MSPSQSEEVEDKVVRLAIVSTLSTIFASQDVTFLRPNKLRKMVCKQIPGATWTQFAECLEKILDNNHGDESSGFQMEQGNIVNKANGSNGTEKVRAQAMTPPSSTKEANPSKESTGSVLQSKNVQVPRAIALHLTRKGFLKKRNIETNSKTKLTIHGIGPASEGLPLDELVTIQITRHRLQSQSENDNEELAIKHVKTAQVLLQKMAESYKKHPDRFAPKKAGGTLEEQEAKKQQAAARQSKTKNIKNKEKVPIKAQFQLTKSKRKKEKFY